MNIFFYILIVIALLLLWLSVVNIFPMIGRIVLKKSEQVKKILNDEEDIKREDI